MSPSVAASGVPAETGAAAGAGADAGDGAACYAGAGAGACDGWASSFFPHPAIAAITRNTARLKTKRALLDMCRPLPERHS